MERTASSTRVADQARGRERIRVVTLVDKLSVFGGAEHLALLTATRLDPARFESVFCVSRWPPAESEDALEAHHAAHALLQESGTRFLALRRRRKLELAPWVRLARFLRRERVDVLHAHKFGSNVWAALVDAVAPVPVFVAHEHTWSYEGQPLRRFLDRALIARRADRFVAVSREDQRRMSSVEHIDPRRTMFIPNGIPPSPPPSGRDVRAELGIERGPVIGAIGVLRAQKAHHVLLRASAELVRTHPSLTVLIAGEGPERASLEGLARELGISDHVRLLGYREDVPDILRALDIAVSSSDFEGSPLAVMEYMDAGLPIVATAVGGVPDLITDGVDGRVVERRDPHALASAISELLGDRELGERMGASARERRRTEFDLDTLVRRLEDLYEGLLGAGKAGRRGG
jgi:glycosyltransferase involved in cell wall biosynthesis